MNIIDIWNLLTQGGLAVAFLFALEGGRRGWYVWRGQYQDKVNQIQEIRKEKNKEIEDLKTENLFWRNYTLKLLDVATKSTNLAEEARVVGEARIIRDAH